MARLLKFFKKSRSLDACSGGNANGRFKSQKSDISDAFFDLNESIVAEIELRLEPEDRKRASLLCCSWRSAFLSSNASLQDYTISISDERQCAKLAPLLERTRNVTLLQAAVDHPQHFQLLYRISALCSHLQTVELVGDRFASPESGWPSSELLEQLYEQAKHNLSRVRKLRVLRQALDASTHLYKLLSACCSLQELRMEVSDSSSCLSLIVDRLGPRVHSLSIEFSSLAPCGFSAQLRAYASLADRGVQLRHLELFTDRRGLQEAAWNLQELLERHPHVLICVTERPYADLNVPLAPLAVRRLVDDAQMHLTGLKCVWPVACEAIMPLPFAQLEQLSCEQLQQRADQSAARQALHHAAVTSINSMALRRLATDSVLLVDCFLDAFANLRVLRLTKLRSAHAAKSDLLPQLARACSLLEELMLPSTRQPTLFTASGQKALFTRLRKLTVSRCQATDREATAFVIEATRLRCLNLTVDCSTTLANTLWTSVLRNCPNVQHVSTSANSRGENDWWTAVCSLANVRHVSVVESRSMKHDTCSFCKDGRKLAVLRACRTLRTVDVAYCFKGANDITFVPNCHGCVPLAAALQKDVNVRFPCKAAGYVELTV